MTKAPKIYRTQKGRYYFKFYGRRIFIDKEITPAELLKYYRKLLAVRRKKLQKKRVRSPSIRNQANAIIKQYYNTDPQKQSAPIIVQKDSGDKDFLLQSILQKLETQQARPRIPPAPVRPPVRGPRLDAEGEVVDAGHVERPVFLDLPLPEQPVFARLPPIAEAPKRRGRPARTSEASRAVATAVRSGVSRSLFQSQTPPRARSSFSQEVDIAGPDVRRVLPGQLFAPRGSALPSAVAVAEPLSPGAQEFEYATRGHSVASRLRPASSASSASILGSPGERVDIPAGATAVRPVPLAQLAVAPLDSSQSAVALPGQPLPVEEEEDVIEGPGPAAPAKRKVSQSYVTYKNVAALTAEIDRRNALRTPLEQLRKGDHKKRFNRSQLIQELELDDARQAAKPQGSGKTEGGIYDDEINEIMSIYPEYLGTIARDEIPKLLPRIKDHKRVAFILNLDAHDKPGSHWVAVFVDARSDGSKSVEYFDSFGRDIPADILKDLKLVVDMLKPDTFLKLKVNHVVHQSDNSDSCGFMAMKYLIDRFRNQSFSSATGYDEKMKHYQIEKREDEIERLKQKPPFSYIGHGL